jgi:hypothetical protein
VLGRVRSVKNDLVRIGKDLRIAVSRRPAQIQDRAFGKVDTTERDRRGRAAKQALQR